MHTCYSPVRRSPAGESKLPPPLPLDLHVLSLSLAFILSQDQTLRCCYVVSFFFQKDSCRHAPGQRSGRLYPARHPLFDSSDQELTGVSVPLFVTLCSCTSLAFVYCNTFNVLSSLTPAPGGRGEKRCKVTDCFPFRQIFRQLFFSRPPGRSRPGRFRRGTPNRSRS